MCGLFCISFMARRFPEFYLWPDVSRHLQLPDAVAPMGGGWKWARLSISQTRDYHPGLETHACHVYTIIWGYLSQRLDWPNGDEHQSIWSAFSVFGGYCPSSRNIFQAGRPLSKLGEHILCLEDIVQAEGIYSKLGEHILCLEDIVQAGGIYSKLREHCPS